MELVPGLGTTRRCGGEEREVGMKGTNMNAVACF